MMMFNQFSVFLLIFIFSGGKCHDTDETTPPPGPADTPQDNDVAEDEIDGKWYAVMATGVSGDGPCDLFTNNQSPCQCMASILVDIEIEGWLVYMSASNNETSTLTVDIGGAEFVEDDDKKINGFQYSRVLMPISAIEANSYSITNKVCGFDNFMQYEMTIMTYSEEDSYMITDVKSVNGGSGNPLKIVWSRNKTPGKEKSWTKILDGLYSVDLNPHDLIFINQIGCKYPSLSQLNEMFFCTAK